MRVRLYAPTFLKRLKNAFLKRVPLQSFTQITKVNFVKVSNTIKKNMKKLITLLFLILFQVAAFACPVCERNQPKVLRGIVHGSGPDSNWDYVSIAITIIIAVLALIYSIKWLWKPNENNQDHIKYSIFK